MFEFKTRSSQPEIMDDFELTGNDLSENLRELQQVNSLLGGYKTVRKGISRLMDRSELQGRSLRIVDLGCGGGDALRMLHHWGRKQNYNFELIGVDANASAISYAREHSQNHPNIRYEQLDILQPALQKIEADVLMFNLFLHHFTQEQIVHIIKTVRRNGANLLINDLQRSQLAFHAFRMLSRTLGFSYISRHDGKLSVRKGFTRSDWQLMLKQAGVEHYELSWQWAFRHLIIAF